MNQNDRTAEPRRNVSRRTGPFDRWGETIRLRRRDSGSIHTPTVMSHSGSTVLVHFEDADLPGVGVELDVLFKGSMRPLVATVDQINLDDSGVGVAKLAIADDTRLTQRRRGVSGRRDHDRSSKSA